MSEWRNQFGQTESECNKICKERYGIDVAAMRVERERKEYGDLILSSAEREKRDREQYGDEFVDIVKSKPNGVYSAVKPKENKSAGEIVSKCDKLLDETKALKNYVEPYLNKFYANCKEISDYINELNGGKTKSELIARFEQLLKED